MTPICYRTTTFLPIVLLLTCTLIHLALAVELPLHYHLFPTENSDEPSAAYLVDIGFDGAVSGTTFSMVCQLDASISQLAVLDERCCASITCNREENPAGLVAIQSCYTRNSADLCAGCNSICLKEQCQKCSVQYYKTDLSLGASTSIEDVVIASTQNSWTSEPSFGCRLGLFDPVGQQRESILSTHLFRKTTPYLALDLNADPATPANNRLYLEQLPSNMASDAPIAWSQRRYSQTACSSEFRSAVFDLAVCGKDVMHALGSNNYLLRLSMTERTLVLPPDLFTAVMKWLPVDCENRIMGFCRLATSATYAQAERTIITFRLAEEGPPMNLPISALLQATAGNAFYFHIKAGATDSKEVVFGTTVLEAFYVIVNYAEARVGFANKAGTDADTQALLAAEGQTLCAVVPTCGVATSYDELTNSCVELSRCPTTVFNIYDVDIRDCDIPALPKLIFFMLAVPTGLLELIAAYRARFLLRKIYSK